MKLRINNRRYIGNKSKLLDVIYEQIIQVSKSKNNIFFDVFAGTGGVANYFAEHGFKAIVNDNLYSNKVVYEAFLGKGKIDFLKLKDILRKFNDIKVYELEENYFSTIYGKKYFSMNDAKKIGFIRDRIEQLRNNILSEREYYYLLTSLIYATDKIANTVGHFESYLLHEPKDKNIFLNELYINENIIPADIYNEDSNSLVRKVQADIAYIDPPYNARQYINFYHVLENLARWNKPTVFEGKSMKFQRNELKSGYCRKNMAKNLFTDLVHNITAKYIVVSYNNTYNAKSDSSNNTILHEEILHILQQRGKLIIKEIDYKSFNAGKTNFNNHKELLYICEVNNHNDS